MGGKHISEKSVQEMESLRQRSLNVASTDFVWIHYSPKSETTTMISKVKTSCLLIQILKRKLTTEFHDNT